MSDDVLHEFARPRGYSDAAVAAGREAYLRKHRLAHPHGRFDEAGRFFLGERCDCCAGLRSPSTQRPHLEMLHGRSLTHVATLYEVPTLHVRRLARAFALTHAGDAMSNHAPAQCLTQLAQILKPVPPCPWRPGGTALRSSPPDPRG